LNLIVIAIPVFFALIAVELVAARVLERDCYRFADSVADLGCGILDQVADVFAKTLVFAGYLLLYDRFRFFSVPETSAWTWAACFVGVDFLYYWFHRFGHEVGAGWAAHAVHHQSEEYNLTVALRQGAFQQLFSWVFYLPLALLGFPPLVFLTCSALNTLYQFWIHTRLVGKLGPLEWVLNTPSHHRVHHGKNPKYVDRNHAGVFIVWDRWFGTFKQEEEEPVYGITTPIRTFDPVRATLYHWLEMAGTAARTRRWADRLRIFTKPPGWRPAELGGFAAPPEVDRATYQRFEIEVSTAVKGYVLAQFVALNLLTAWFLNRQADLAPGMRVAAGLGIVASVVCLGGLLDRRGWAPVLEAVRAACLVLLAVYLGVRS
jgi:sterol desaturase/sphingolipid hydroxylase (fatty acid hydroxylase superfamily)